MGELGDYGHAAFVVVAADHVGHASDELLVEPGANQLAVLPAAIDQKVEHPIDVGVAGGRKGASHQIQVIWEVRVSIVRRYFSSIPPIPPAFASFGGCHLFWLGSSPAWPQVIAQTELAPFPGKFGARKDLRSRCGPQEYRKIALT